MKTQKVLGMAILIVVVLAISLGGYLYKKSGHLGQVANSTVITRNKTATSTNSIPVSTSVVGFYVYYGAYAGEKPNVKFFIKVGVDGKIGEMIPGDQVSHYISLVFINQDEAIRKFNIDTSMLKKPGYCTLRGPLSQEILVTGFDIATATKDPATWSYEVNLDSVVTRSTQEMVCEEGEPW